MSALEALLPTTHRLSKAVAHCGRQIDPTNHKHRVALCMTALEDMVEEEDWQNAHKLVESLGHEIAMIRRDLEADETGFVRPPRD